MLKVADLRHQLTDDQRVMLGGTLVVWRVRHNLPLTFDLRAEARQPNRGSGGRAQTDDSISWSLFLPAAEIAGFSRVGKKLLPASLLNLLVEPVGVLFRICRSCLAFLASALGMVMVSTPKDQTPTSSANSSPS
jgi:hypothetical protein